MKLVTAIIRPHKVNEVKDGLRVLGVQGMTISEVRGHGRQRGHVEVYRGAEYQVDFVPKIRLEILVEDLDADLVVAALRGAAHSGRIGDGKIWVAPVEEVVRIRTGERGPDAI